MERSENYIKFNYKVKFYTKCFLQEVLKTLNHFCLQDIFYLLRSYFYHLAKLYLQFIRQLIKRMYVKEDLRGSL